VYEKLTRRARSAAWDLNSPFEGVYQIRRERSPRPEPPPPAPPLTPSLRSRAGSQTAASLLACRKRILEHRGGFMRARIEWGFSDEGERTK
jgi:hypothetical protein